MKFRFFASLLMASAMFTPFQAVADPVTVEQRDGVTRVGLSALEGEVEVIHADSFESSPQPSEFLYLLQTTDGDTVQLKLDPGQSSGVHGGAHIRVVGERRVDGTFHVKHFDKPHASVTATGDADHGKAKTVRTVLVVLLNFADDPSQPLTADEARAAYFGGRRSVDSYYRASSFGQLGFQGRRDVAGDVVDWITLPATDDHCFRWVASRNDAIEAVQAAGWDLVSWYDEFHRPRAFNYDHVSFVLPDGNSCFVGLGNLNGTFSWVAASQVNYSVAQHEIGHNLDLDHANRWNCEKDGVRTTIRGSCRSSEYGDPFDVMGTGPYQFNTYNKARLGWLKPHNIHTLNESSGEFVFDVEPNEFPTDGIMGLRVARGDGTYYLVDYRQPAAPFDDFAPTSEAVLGAMLRIVPEWDVPYVRKSQLLEVRPPCCNLEALVGAAKPNEGHGLLDGTRFSDGALLSITQLSHSSTSVRVKITYGPDVAAPTAPQNAAVLPTDPWANAPVLIWDPATDDGAIEEYVIEREASPGEFEEVGRTAAYQYTFTLDPADLGRNVRVRALDAADHASPYSNLACVLAAPCPAPLPFGP